MHISVLDLSTHQLVISNVVDGGPWRKAKNLTYRTKYGATIPEYGAAILHKIGHDGKPKFHHQYPPWPIFDNTSKQVYQNYFSVVAIFR